METKLNNDSDLGDITAGAFKGWLQTCIQTTVASIFKIHAADISKELDKTKVDITATKKDFSATKQDLSNLRTEHNALLTNVGVIETCCKNTTGYLINHDRNVRQSNIVLFGVTESEDITHDNISVKNDEEKIKLILKIVECDSEATKIIRMGKKEVKKDRPIKVVLPRPSDAKKAISNSKNLKVLQKKIFLKGDKTKSEQKESTRLHKKKQECLAQYPNVDKENP